MHTRNVTPKRKTNKYSPILISAGLLACAFFAFTDVPAHSSFPDQLLVAVDGGGPIPTDPTGGGGKAQALPTIIADGGGPIPTDPKGGGGGKVQALPTIIADGGGPIPTDPTGGGGKFSISNLS